MYLYAKLFSNVFKTLTESLVIWNCDGGSAIVITSVSSVVVSIINISGHSTSLENFSIVGREENNLSRLIKESMYIRVNGPSLNKNIGKFHLPHLWDEVLNNSRELKLK